MPLTAVRHVRKMRGGAQSHLLEADDGHWYVVKFRNNPQHRRILVNERLSATLLDYLKIATPETALIQVGAAFLAANPEVHLHLGTQRIADRARLAFRLALPRRPRPHRGLRFPPRRASAPGGQPGGFPRHPGVRQVGGQRRWPPVGVLPRPGAARRIRGARWAGPSRFCGPHDRPRLHLQRARTGISPNRPCKVSTLAAWSTRRCARWRTFSPGWTRSCTSPRR